jgi:hypothetical protein
MLYSGSTTVGTRAFVWTETDGFSDLGSLVRGGLTAAQWQSLAEGFAAAGSRGGGYPMYIAGYGQGVGDAGVGTVFLLTPEPTSLASILLLAGALLRRSRRKVPIRA